MGSRIEVIKGDITRLDVDAIVNAANSTLLGGGGVDGAIHRAAGPQLLAECRLLNGCSTGEAVITKGYNLPARFIIHTVGPVWRGGNNNEAGLLRNCYVNSIKIAVEYGLRTIAFPSISTGAYGYPVREATKIAFGVVNEMIDTYEQDIIKKVVFVCFDDINYARYKELIGIAD